MNMLIRNKIEKGKRVSYLYESYMIDALVFLIWSLNQVLIYIFEVGNEHIFHKVLILLYIVVFQKDFVVVDDCLIGKV